MAEMNPKAAMPTATRMELETTQLSLSARVSALEGFGLAANAPIALKPMRPAKEPLPVATEVDLDYELPAQPQGLAPAAHSAASASKKEAKDEAPAPPAVAISFDGGDDTGVSIPPDTAGAVSATHVFNPLNNDVVVFDRAGAQLQRLSLDAFWQAFHAGVSTFDPRAVFDPFEQRFYFVTMADAGRTTSSLLVAVSENDDPTGNWHTVRIQVDDAEQGPVWLDYPSLGFTQDKITVQVNLFRRDSNRFAGSTVYVFDKASFLQPPHTPAVATFVMTDQGGTQVPATTYDASLQDQFLVSRWSGNVGGQGLLAIFEITGAVTGNIAIRRVGFIRGSRSWASRSPAGDLGPQDTTSQRIDCGDDRLLSVVFRDNSLWCSHTIFVPTAAPTRCGAQWWEIGAPAFGLIQEGLLDDPDGDDFFAFPTLAVNAANDVVMGLSQFNSNAFASCAFAHRRAADPAGQMQGPTRIHAGRDRYFKTFGGSANRWGDYSATQVDPDDDTFWTVQEYADSPADRWATRWAHIRI